MYTQITQQEIQELEDIFVHTKTISLAKTKESTAYFAYHSLGLIPRRWQSVFWRQLDDGFKRILCVTPRQIGKSTAIATFALKAAAYNIRPKGVNKKTHIGIISATEEQSKRIMLEIRRLILMGDQHVAQTTSNKIVRFYTSMIDDSRSAENNKTTITFRNGNTIVCLPPTQRVRGYYFSYVFLDEAAFIEDGDIFFQYIEPTTSNTDGVIVMTTTPNGMQGWFYELFDPENKRENQYHKLWFHYAIMEEEHPDWIKDVEAKKRFYTETGRERQFEQEYEAKFTSQTSAFFDALDIDQAINAELGKLEGYDLECHLGIDFGMVHSKTVLTICSFNGEKISLIYDYIYMNDDSTLVQDAKALQERFNIQKIIVDDCPEGHYAIQQLENLGVQITRMNFRGEKVKKYFALRKAFKKKKIVLYKNPELIAQLKALQQIETPMTTKIQKPYGGRDDYPDSLVLSTYHFTEEDEPFTVDIAYEIKAVNPMEDNPRKRDQTVELYQSDEYKLWNEVLK